METEQPDLARHDLAPAPRYMWQWSTYTVVCCDGAVWEHLSVDGNPAGLHFQNVTGNGSNNLRDRLGSARAIALLKGNPSDSFLCDRCRQAGTNELAVFDGYSVYDPVNPCWCGAVGERNAQAKDPAQRHQECYCNHWPEHREDGSARAPKTLEIQLWNDRLRGDFRRTVQLADQDALKWGKGREKFGENGGSAALHRRCFILLYERTTFPPLLHPSEHTTQNPPSARTRSLQFDHRSHSIRNSHAHRFILRPDHQERWRVASDLNMPVRSLLQAFEYALSARSSPPIHPSR